MQISPSEQQQRNNKAVFAKQYSPARLPGVAESGSEQSKPLQGYTKHAFQLTHLQYRLQLLRTGRYTKSRVNTAPGSYTLQTVGSFSRPAY